MLENLGNYGTISAIFRPFSADWLKIPKIVVQFPVFTQGRFVANFLQAKCDFFGNCSFAVVSPL